MPTSRLLLLWTRLVGSREQLFTETDLKSSAHLKLLSAEMDYKRRDMGSWEAPAVMAPPRRDIADKGFWDAPAAPRELRLTHQGLKPQEVSYIPPSALSLAVATQAAAGLAVQASNINQQLRVVSYSQQRIYTQTSLHTCIDR